MKILTANGARNIAQSAQHHVRSWLVHVNSCTRSDHGFCHASGTATTKSQGAKSICSSVLTKSQSQRSKDHLLARGVSETQEVGPARDEGSDAHSPAASAAACACYDHGDSHGAQATQDCEVGDPHAQKLAGSSTSLQKQNTQPERSLSMYSKKPSSVVSTYCPKLDSFTLNSGKSNHDLRRFLDVIGTEPKEARYWFKYFKKVTTSTTFFGVVQIDDDILRQSEAIHRPSSDEYNLEAQSPLNELCSYLAFLQRYDMKCVIVHGRSTPDSLSQEEIQKLQRQTIDDTRLITDLLEKNGAQVRQASVPPVHVVHTESGSAWSVSDIDSSYLDWIQMSGGIPILTTLALSPSQQLVSASLFEVTAAVSVQLLPLKVLIVNMDGGIMDQDGKVIPKLNLPHEEGAACKSPWCTDSVKNKIHDISVLLSRLQEEQCRLGKPPDSAVIITSGTTLLTELFTHNGSGTFFKIMEKIHSYKSLEDVDTERLTDLIELAFQRKLKPDYLETITDDVDSIFISEGYSAAAIILKEPGVPVPYLDKFVVRKDYQDNSVGCTLWNAIEHAYPQLFWRSRNINHINSWYFKHSKGSWSDTEWTVFWYGIHQHRLTSELIDYALNKPASFTEPDPQKKISMDSRSSPWSALQYM